MFAAHPAPARVRARGLSISLALALVATSCADADAAAPAPVVTPAPVASAAPQNPFAGLAAPADARLAGRVEERLAAGSYVYLAVRGDDDALRWVVVMGAAPQVGEAFAARSAGVRRDFRSPRLGRAFAELHFAIPEVAR